MNRSTKFHRIWIAGILMAALLALGACASPPASTSPATQAATTPQQSTVGTAAQSAAASSVPATDPLPSWNEGPVKQAILKFVADVTDPAGASYVPPEERIAVTDNDGTLWTEKPLAAQAAFVNARIEE